MKILVCVLMSIVVMTSCKMSAFKSGIKGNGKMISEEITIDDYSSISVSNQFDIVYTQKTDEKPYLRIEVDENLIDYISATVENNKLTIKSTSEINPKYYTIFTNSTSLYKLSSSGISNIELKDSIHSENLEISGSGVGNITAGNLYCENLKINMSGVADITLGGETTNSDMSVSGKANINAYELKSKNANCSVSGMGYIDLYASERLSAHVSGIGKINYKGNPKDKELSTSGIGSIKAKE